MYVFVHNQVVSSGNRLLLTIYTRVASGNEFGNVVFLCILV